MNRQVTLLALLLLPLVAAAQSAVTTAGGTARNATHTFSYSLGQTAVASTADLRLREGTVQPVTVEEVGIGNRETKSGKLEVFPNPTVAKLTIRREESKSQPLELYTLDGRLLMAKRWDTGTDLTLDLTGLVAGVYMLNIDGRTFKITKQ